VKYVVVVALITGISTLILGVSKTEMMKNSATPYEYVAHVLNFLYGQYDISISNASLFVTRKPEVVLSLPALMSTTTSLRCIPSSGDGEYDAFLSSQNGQLYGEFIRTLDGVSVKTFLLASSSLAYVWNEGGDGWKFPLTLSSLPRPVTYRCVEHKESERRFILPTGQSFKEYNIDS